MTEPTSVDPAAKPARWLAHPALVCLLLAAMTLGVFYPVVRQRFVSFDDPDYVTANAHVKGGLSAEDVAWAFRSGHAGNWHPLTWMSHQLDVQLYGLNPAGHHLTNLLLHTVNVVLLFLVLRGLAGSLESRVSGLGSQISEAQVTWRCFCVAALFAIHPLHVESVAWVSERKDVLSGMLFLLTIWAYGRHVEIRRPKSEEKGEHPTSNIQHPTSNEEAHATLNTFHASHFYVLSLLFFALGLMAKPMLVTVPFVLLLLDYWPLARLRRRSLESKVSSLESTEGTTRNTDHPTRITQHARKSYIVNRIFLEKVPFLALSVASCVATVLAQKKAIQPLANLSIGVRVGNALVSYVRYLGKTFWPFNLATPYPHPGHWPLGCVLLSAALLAGLSVAALWLGMWRMPLTPSPSPSDGERVAGGRVRGGAIYEGWEHPTSNAGDVRGNWMLDVFSPGSAGFLVTGWFWFLGMLVPVIGLVQVGEQSMADRYTYLPLIGIFIIVVWGGASLGSWVSSLKSQVLGPKAQGLGQEGLIWQHPTSNIQHPTSNEGLVRKQWMLDVGCWMLDVLPPFLAVAVLLGCALRTRDQLQYWHDSERLYRHAVAISRKNFIACYNLGSWLASEGRTEEALTNYFKAVEMQPHYTAALNNIGCIMAARKQYAEAMRYFEAALKSQPGFVDAHANMAAALRETGRYGEAIPHLRVVVKERPEDTGALNGLGNVLAGQRRFAEAAECYEASLRVKPDQPAAHYDLANALANLRRPDAAVEQYRLALKAKPDFAQAQNDLGVALARQGKLDEAIEELRAAVRSKPDDPAFRLNLGKMLAARQDVTEAIPCFNEAVRLAPDNSEAHNGLGSALAMTGQLDAAIVQFREALRLRPDNASASANLSRALAAQGKTE